MLAGKALMNPMFGCRIRKTLEMRVMMLEKLGRNQPGTVLVVGAAKKYRGPGLAVIIALKKQMNRKLITHYYKTSITLSKISGQSWALDTVSEI